MKQIYLDYAAATPVRKEVLQEMRKFETLFANPSSVHGAGVRAREVLEDARGRVGKILGASGEDKIIFTSGGTESINLALLGFARANRSKGKHIITSAVEHKAVLETCKQLEREGFIVDYIGVDEKGVVDVDEIATKIKKDTILVSIQSVNNEIGVMQPIVEIGKLLKIKKIAFHVDACQAGLLDLDVNRLGVDLLTLNSSKVYGPHGVGLLYVREGIAISPVIFGGGQEYGLRSGTENVAGIVGFALALSLLQKERKKELMRLQGLRARFVADLKKNIGDVVIVSDLEKSVPTILSVGFRGVEAETVVRALSALKVYISAGSACTVQQIEVSHVLKAMRVEEDVARGVVRFSFGRETHARDLKMGVVCVKKVVESLRMV